MGMIKLPEKSIRFFHEQVNEIFNTGQLAEGKWNRAVAEFVREYTGAKYAVPCCSNGAGTVALLQMLRESRGRSRAVIQSNTMYGVKTMVHSAGYRLDGFIPCQRNTLMPSLEDTERAINEIESHDELVVILSHIGGIINPDIVEIAAFCRKKNVMLIEDCAHSFGALLDGRHSGLFGDAGVYSFYATKAVPVGEGGVIVTNDDQLGSMSGGYVMYDRFEQQLRLGVNIRVSELHALMMYSVIREVEHIIENKNAIAKRYVDVCRQLEIPFISQDENGCRGNYYKFIVLSSSGDVTCDYPALETKTSAVYDYALGSSDDITRNHVCLPIWYGQPSETTAKVVDELMRCFSP